MYLYTHTHLVFPQPADPILKEASKYYGTIMSPAIVLSALPRLPITLGKEVGDHPNIMDKAKTIPGHEGLGCQRFKDLFKKCKFNKRDFGHY